MVGPLVGQLVGQFFSLAGHSVGWLVLWGPCSVIQLVGLLVGYSVGPSVDLSVL